MNIGDTVKIKDGQFQGEVCTVEKMDRLAISGGHQCTLRRACGDQLWVRDERLEVA